MFCPSALGARTQTVVKPLFLYHARRTGGMAFYNTLFHAIDFTHSWMQVDEKDRPKMGRVEISDFPPELFKEYFLLVGSHAPLGLHHKFNYNFQLTSLFRDSFPRVRSMYLSRCMRKQVQPTQFGFEKFFASSENCNGTTKQLCGLRPQNTKVTKEHLELAKQVLLNKFHSFAMNDHIEELISVYLTEMGLPNIVMERVNQTIPEYQIDLNDMRKHVEEINSLDCHLIEEIRTLSHIPHTDVDEVEIAPLTVIVRELGSAKETAATSIAMPTIQFIEILETRPTILDDLTNFWNLAK